MRWQRGFSWLILAAVPAFLSLWSSFGCGSAEDLSSIKFTVPNQFPQVNSELVITVEAKDKEGKPVPDGSALVIRTTLGSFDGTKSMLSKNLSTTNGIATLTFYTRDKAGTAILTAQSEFKSNNLTLIILEEEKVPEPVVEPKVELVPDAGPQEVVEKDSNVFIPLVIKMDARKTKLKADGTDITEITAKITEPKIPIQELMKMKMVFRTSLGTLLDTDRKPLKEVPGTNGEYEIPYKRGTFKVLLRSGVRAGTAIVEAGVSNNTFDGQDRIQVNIVELGFLEFEELKPDTIGVRGSGKEVTVVRVKVLDTNNEVFPEGTRVFFSLTNPIGGASVTTSEALTDDKGIAFTQVKSGTAVGAVAVKAVVAIEVNPKVSGCPTTCNVDSDCGACGYSCHLGKCKKTIDATSTSIAIVGGRPSYRGLTFSCDNRNIPALAGRIGSKIPNTIDVKCTVKLADRFTNKISFSTQVLFMSEAGAINPSARTAGSGDAVGTASVTLRTQNPAPVDVTPMSVPNVNNCTDPKCTQPQNGGYWMPYNCTKSTNLAGLKTLYLEPSYVDSFGRVRNPRDGLATIVAYTNGEEQFTDTNKNGRYDTGEPFIDVGEPYLDVNDNGKWDSKLPGLPTGEPFVDIPCTQQQARNKINGCKVAGIGNGRRDGPNGTWDSDTLIWAKTWVLWTGCTARTVPSSKFVKEKLPVNLRSCTQIPFQSGLWALKDNASGLNSDPAKSYGLADFEPFKTYSISTKKTAFVKALWHDENLNSLGGPNAKAEVGSANIVTVTLEPGDGVFPGARKFGFTPHSLLLPATGAAFIDNLVIVPTTFYGTTLGNLFSHTLLLSDEDQQDGPLVPSSVSLTVTSGGGQFNCNRPFGLSGNTK